jgi:hypothetical protein
MVAQPLARALRAGGHDPAPMVRSWSAPSTGKAGQYKSIQSAVNAAHPGDWILVAPGDYHETDDLSPTWPAPLSTGTTAVWWCTHRTFTIRGMNRDTVIVDGTKAGAPTVQPGSAVSELRPGRRQGQGRNGIVVWKADNVSIENLTACNFLGGAGDSGNEIWWNGGDGSGKIGLTGYTGQLPHGDHLLLQRREHAAEYGIFSSNSRDRAVEPDLRLSNMNDSGMYVGACHQVCDVTIDHAWMENNALGYSGTNSGGAVVIENSQFDNNEDGVDTNTQIAGDPPAPQNGDCPDNGGISPITHTHSCWVFIHNNVHDNNNPNAPEAGNAAAGPIGTGMTLSGGRNDTVMDNTFSNNGAWGVLFVPTPTRGTPSLNQKCANRWVPDVRARLRLRARGRRAEGQHLRQRRLLRQSQQLRLRPDCPTTPGLPSRTASPTTRAQRQRPGQPGAVQPTCGVGTGAWMPVAWS